MAQINSTVLGYVGSYYQWENNWGHRPFRRAVVRRRAIVI
jgi:hypothetical protein